MWQLRSRWLLLGWLVAGCARLDPAPAMLAPEALQLQMRPAPDFAASRWWLALGDPVLDALIEQALAHSPRLSLAQAKERAAAAGQALAAAGAGPALDLAYSRNRQRYSADSIYPPPIAGSWQTLEQVGMTLNWRLDLWGQVSERVAAEAGAVAAARYESVLAKQWLCAEVAGQYLALRSALWQQALASEAVRLSRARLEQTAWRLRAGLADGAQLAAAEQALAQAQAQQVPWAAQVRAGQAVLAGLSAQPQAAIRVAAGEQWPQWQIDSNSWSLAAISHRPELAAARQMVESAAHRVRAARADFYPDLSLGLLLGLSSLNPATLFDAASRELGVTPALSLPLYRAGALQGQLDAEQAAYAMAVARYNQTLLDIATQTATALSQQQAAVHAEAAAQRVALAAERQARAGEQLFVAGLASRDDVLAASEHALAARQQWLSARAQRLQAQLLLVRAVGDVPHSVSEKF